MNPQPPPRERPILFSTPMVRAILDGRKTQTRRVIKPQPEQCGFGQNAAVRPYCTGTDWPVAYYEMRGACWNSSKPIKCPHGQPGSRLWVRETWASIDGVGIKYRADNPGASKPSKYWDVTWKPSIFMPRWVSRITLEITAVRVQRVQDISDGDAFAEGVGSAIDRISPHFPGKWISLYRDLWDTINKKRGFGWDTNPWCWCLTFKRL